jgi:HEPN domain-containing protein
MRKFSIILAVAALLISVLGSSESAHAQGSDNIDPQRVRDAIERTDEVIASAVDIVRDTRSQKARTALDYAMKLQERAKSSASLTNNALAYQLTNQSRKEAWHSINLARTAVRQEEVTKRLAEHTNEKLIMLRARIAETGVRDNRMLMLMNESQGLLDKARINYQQLRGELALNLTQSAHRLANRAEERFRRSLNLMEMCQRRLDLLERLSERAYELVSESGDEKATNRLRMAEDHLARARISLASGRYEQCRINLEKSERILRSITRNASRGRAGDPEEMLAEARRLQQRAEEMISAGERTNDGAHMLLEQAGRMLDRAESELAGGNNQEAERLIEDARRMLRTAVEQARSQVPPEQAADIVEKVAELGETVRSRIEQCEAEGASQLLSRADEHMALARMQLEKGFHDRAVAEARIARNLYNRVREICAR